MSASPSPPGQSRMTGLAGRERLTARLVISVQEYTGPLSLEVCYVVADEVYSKQRTSNGSHPIPRQISTAQVSGNSVNDCSGRVQ